MWKVLLSIPFVKTSWRWKPERRWKSIVPSQSHMTWLPLTCQTLRFINLHRVCLVCDWSICMLFAKCVMLEIGKNDVHTERLDLPVFSYGLHFQMIRRWKSETVRLKWISKVLSFVDFWNLHIMSCLFSSPCFCKVLKMLSFKSPVQPLDAYMMVLCCHYSRKCLRVGDKTILRGFPG